MPNFYFFRGKLRTIASLATEYRLSINTIYQRIQRGWTLEEAIQGPGKDGRRKCNVSQNP